MKQWAKDVRATALVLWLAAVFLGAATSNWYIFVFLVAPSLIAVAGYMLWTLWMLFADRL